MRYITALEYTSITGETAPADFSTLEEIAAAVVDAHTLYGYYGRATNALPSPICDALKRAVAFQVMLLAGMGLETANDTVPASVTLGKFSLGASGGINDVPLATVTANDIPLLTAYARGLFKNA